MHEIIKFSNQHSQINGFDGASYRDHLESEKCHANRPEDSPTTQSIGNHMADHRPINERASRQQ